VTAYHGAHWPGRRPQACRSMCRCALNLNPAAAPARSANGGSFFALRNLAQISPRLSIATPLFRWRDSHGQAHRLVALGRRADDRGVVSDHRGRDLDCLLTAARRRTHPRQHPRDIRSDVLPFEQTAASNPHLFRALPDLEYIADQPGPHGRVFRP